MIRRAVIAWVLMIPAAILNGVFRNSVVEPIVGELPAHQISVVTGSALFLGVAYYLLRDHAGKAEDHTLLGIGASWVAATILFEFGFGHYVVGHSWDTLLHDYNVAEGRLWPVVLLVVFLGPLIVKRIVNRTRAAGGSAHTSGQLHGRHS